VLQEQVAVVQVLMVMVNLVEVVMAAVVLAVQKQVQTHTLEYQTEVVTFTRFQERQILEVAVAELPVQLTHHQTVQAEVVL
jgi:hypothetical protein